MAGVVIHLAVGNEYLRKYKGEIKNEKEFLKGIIAPDQTTDKRTSHYGLKVEEKSLINFLNKYDKSKSKDFLKGYFLHLYTDHVFYSKYVPKVILYNDYDRTNKYIIEKYHVKVPEDLKHYAQYIDGEPEYLKFELLDKFIDDMTKRDIDKIIKDLKGEK